MDRVQQVVRFAVLAVAGLGATGCASPQGVPASEALSHTVRKMNPWAEARPATQVVTFWQRSLTRLPDPARGGVLAPGLAGQLFLITPESEAADVAGDVTVAVYDETRRPNGGAARTPEVFHFTAAVLKNLGTRDERFGRNYVLFLPWPEAWTDVTTVRVLTRYDPSNGPTLHAGEVKMALDLNPGSGPVWSENGPPGPVSQTAAVSVPDGAKMLQQVRATQATQGAAPVVVPAGGLIAP